MTETDTPALHTYHAKTNIPYRITDDVTAVLTEDPVKILVIDLKDHEALVRFQKETEDWADGKLGRLFSCDEYLEHMACGISKGGL